MTLPLLSSYDLTLFEKTSGKTVFLWRGVRSDAQLSSTETRFQKCSQSGKNGSKHPMLSISMAYNVISCKKVERNTQKLKIAARTTNLDVLSGKEFKSVSQMVLTDSSFRKCKKNLRFSLITANFSFCFKKFPRYFFYFRMIYRMFKNQ